jgi:hypothetical protein
MAGGRCVCMWSRRAGERARRREPACADLRPLVGPALQVLQQLQEQPPPALTSIQSRLACLYPEYELCHMPAAALLEADTDEPLSSFVANAVLAGTWVGGDCMAHAWVPTHRRAQGGVYTGGLAGTYSNSTAGGAPCCPPARCPALAL